MCHGYRILLWMIYEAIPMWTYKICCENKEIVCSLLMIRSVVFAPFKHLKLPISIIIPHVNSPYKTSIAERLIFYNITRCYSDGEYCHSFAIAAGDIVKYQSFVWCATAMRVRFVHARIRSTAMADMKHDFGHFQLPITSLFIMARNIKCGYSFS